ncbi:efflux RND transporter periplasmic adaptor subunit [Caballeronia catudaia]|uniref:efflux RND transporter periplasmic adaptor subunit n=1 Tax=Caballeronia catudaia TaxID=1777136 RepID=UPI0038995337
MHASRADAEAVRLALDTEVERKTAEADLASSRATLSALDGRVLATRYQIAALLGNGPDRGLSIAETGAVSGEDIAHARDAVSVAQAALDAVRQQSGANHALTDRTSVERHPNVQAAAAKVRDAWLDDARNTLPAPVTGYVARRSVQVGQRVAPGAPLMAIVPLDGVWVDANFKEVQLAHMRIGQPVTLTADAYGAKVKYHGHVRIRLDQRELDAHPLRIGLSMDAEVETRDQSGTQLGAALAFFERSLTTQAAMLGLNDSFWLSAVIFIAIVPLIWLTKPGKGAGAGSAGGH